MNHPLLILASSRSFTSVICAALGQHPQMYGLPELHLFVADTLAGRERFQARSKFIRRARRALAEGENQLVLELMDVILGARPKNGAARQMRRAALERLAARATNGVEQNIYRGAAAALRGGAPAPTRLTTVRLQFSTTHRSKNERATSCER